MPVLNTDHLRQRGVVGESDLGEIGWKVVGLPGGHGVVLLQVGAVPGLGGAGPGRGRHGGTGQVPPVLVCTGGASPQLSPVQHQPTRAGPAASSQSATRTTRHPAHRNTPHLTPLIELFSIISIASRPGKSLL